LRPRRYTSHRRKTKKKHYFASEALLYTGFSGTFEDFPEFSRFEFRTQQQNTTFKTVFFTPNRDGLGSGANVPGINKRTHVRTVVKRSQTTRFQEAFDYFNAKNSKTYYSISHQI